MDGNGRMLVLPLGGKLEAPGYSPQDMALDSLRNVPTGRICGALGLDPMVLGLPSENKTYANYEEANEAAIETALLPLKRVVARTLTRQALKEPKRRCFWDYSEVRALQDDVDALYKRVVDAYAKGAIMRSEAKQMLGLPHEKGDQVYIHDVMVGLDAAKASLKRDLGEKARLHRQAMLDLGIEHDEDDEAA